MVGRQILKIGGIFSLVIEFDFKGNFDYLCLAKIARGGAVAARRAHNPKVGGSNPSPATKKRLAFLDLGRVAQLVRALDS
jgi:hypothetical protein